MGKASDEAFNDLEDRLMALEYAFAIMAKELHLTQALDIQQLTRGLAALAAEMRSSSTDLPQDSNKNLTPVAEHLDYLHGVLEQALSTR